MAKYTDLAVETGVAVKPSDTVYLQTNVTRAQLAHLIVAAAYRAGAAKVNLADTHVNFMMGSAQMNIAGIARDSQRVALFRNGDWA